MSTHTFRQATTHDIEATLRVRAATRENPASAARLASLGMTPASIAAAMLAGGYKSWVCEHDGVIVGFCNADIETGEVVVLAVLPEHERQGVGRRLLSLAVAALQSSGCSRIWLFADPDSGKRSHGFYRANGWVPGTRVAANGDEELVFVG